MVLIAVYGTLRKNHYNYHHYNLNLQYIAQHLGTTTIEGYKLYDYKGLPLITETYDFDDKVTVDIFNIRDTKTYWQLQLMEQTTGYFTDIQTININKQEHHAIIWTITEQQIPREAKEIPSGDWDKHKNYKKEEEKANANIKKK